jgi:septal ring-binding cell division protein DamX
MELPTKGSLVEISFIEILKQAAEESLTGMIRLETGPVIKVVYLQQGTIAFASSNDKSDRLTEVLKRAGKLTPEQIEHAQAKLRPNVSLGKTLVELGYISPKDLLWGARMQVENILHQLLFWDQGSYQILEGPLPKEIVSLNLSAHQIIYEGILRSNDRHWVLQMIGSPEAVYEASPDFPEINAALRLPVVELVSRLNGKRTLQQVAEAAGLDTFEACKMVSVLQIFGMVRRGEQPVQMPLVVAEAEHAVEAATEEGGASETVSLGQVLQIPSVEELQQEPEEPVIGEAVQEESAPTMQLIEPPPQASPVADHPSYMEPGERPEAEEQAPAEYAESTLPEEPGFGEPQASESDEEAFADREPSPGPGLLEGMSFSVRKKTTPYQYKTVNWQRLSLIVALIAVVTVAGAIYFQQMRTRKALSMSKTERVPQPPPLQKPQTEATTEMNPPTTEETGTPETPEAKKPPEKAGGASGPTSMVLDGRIQEASLAWFRQLSAAPKSNYTLQLEIACQAQTVSEAFSSFPDPAQLMVIPISYKGRMCYRVIFGLFSSEAAANGAIGEIPAMFMNQQPPPKPVQLSKIIK